MNINNSTESKKIKDLLENACFCIKKHEYSQVDSILRKVYYLDPKNPDIYNLTGLCFLALNDLKSAKTWFQRALVLAPHIKEYQENFNRILKEING